MQKVIPHNLDKDKAKKVIDKAVAEYSDEYPQYNPQFKWASSNVAKLSLSALGKTITADITLNDADVTVDLTVPPAFKIFEKKALDTIDAEVKKWLRLAKSGKV